MHKRTLYITEESYEKVEQLSKANSTSRADILRQAVELGLKNMSAENTVPEVKQGVPPTTVVEENPQSEVPTPDPTLVIHNHPEPTEAKEEDTIPNLSANHTETEQSQQIQTDVATEDKSMKKYVENQISSALHKLFK